MTPILTWIWKGTSCFLFTIINRPYRRTFWASHIQPREQFETLEARAKEEEDDEDEDDGFSSHAWLNSYPRRR